MSKARRKGYTFVGTGLMSQLNNTRNQIQHNGNLTMTELKAYFDTLLFDREFKALALNFLVDECGYEPKPETWER